MPRSKSATSNSFSIAEARRLALAAQGFGAGRETRPGKAKLVAAIDRLGLLQIDSVNVLVRSHYLPLFARLGAYDVARLDRLCDGRDRHLFEYWGHEASLLPVALQPLFRWRMAEARAGKDVYSGLAKFANDNRAFCARVLDEVRDRGPLGASELSHAGKSSGGWWGWSQGKHAVEWLFWTGELTTHSRRRFERVYDLTERTLASSVLDLPTPSPADAQRALLRHAVGALGVATERDLRDYYRLGVAATRARLAELVEAGEACVCAVEGCKDPAYVARDVRAPRSLATRALLSPFDSLVFERSRTERLFGFRYRIELYTPQHKRRFGYYVLPFLLGDRIVARVDLKADRKASVLRALAAHAETGADPGTVAVALADELGRMARWLGLSRVVAGRRGDLVDALRASLRG